MASREYHVMMFPWLAFGHMIPFLEFSKKLAAKGIRVSFITTRRNIQRLPPIPPAVADKINLVEIPLPSVEGLPENCEATMDVQPDQMGYLKKACDSLQAQFEKVVCEDLPDLILFDFVLCWVPETAEKFGVVSGFLSAYSAATLAFTGPPSELKACSRRTKPEDLTVPPDWFPFPSLVAYRPDLAAIVHRNLNFQDISGMSSGHRLAKALEGCDFVAVRSCNEFEGEYLKLLEDLYQKPVLPVGVLPPKFPDNKAHDCKDSSWISIFKWLDKQEQKSVIFVGFGSEYDMPMEQVHELAHGIELSNLPFIWILKKPEGLDSLNVLPSAFLARTSNRGLVYFGWAPQTQVLAHPAIGGCLFHSGWGSIIESLAFGHSQILMPMVLDQGLNAKLLVEKGIGFEVQRNEDGSFNQEGVAESMRLVMVAPEGEALRRKAAQFQKTFGNQTLHDDYLSKFIDYLISFKKRREQGS